MTIIENKITEAERNLLQQNLAQPSYYFEDENKYLHFIVQVRE